MELEYYLHGLKWKDIETTEEDVLNGVVTFHVMDNFERSSDLEYIQVRKIYFEIENGPWERIPFDHVSHRQMETLIQMAKSGISELEFQGRKIQDINLRDCHFTLGGKRASCNNPHIYVNFEGRLAYREIELEEQPVFLMKVKKTVFDLIDLE